MTGQIDLSPFETALRKARRGSTRDGKRCIKACCPFHEDDTPSFAVFESGAYYCLGCGVKGGVDSLCDHLGLPRQSPSEDWRKTKWLEAIYEYKDLQGSVVGIVERWRYVSGEKKPLPKTVNPTTGEWEVKIHNPFPIYHWNEVAAAPLTTPVWWSEGEKTSDCLAKHGLLATTTQGGSKAFSRCAKASLRALERRRVFILPDADDAGEAYATEVQRGIANIASEAVIVRLPGLGEGEDCVEWFQRGGTREELERIATSASDAGAESHRLARLCRRVAATLEGGGDVGVARKELLKGAAALGGRSNSSVTAAQALEALIARMESGIDKQGLWWNIPAMDEIQGMLLPGHVVTIAGDSGAGKTALALQLVDDVAGTGLPCFVVSQEMASEEVVGRFAARMCGKPLAALTVDEVRCVCDAYRDMPIEIYDRCVDIDFLEAELRQWAAMHERCGVVMIDFIQLMQGGAKQSEWDIVKEASRRLKDLAKELGVVMLILCQFANEFRKFGNRAPTRGDLRSAGPLLEASDKVWLLWQPEQGIGIEAILDKNRQGPTGRCRVLFDKPCFKFTSLGDASLDNESAFVYCDDIDGVEYFAPSK